jgi:Zn-dependent M28 family amino/carboxypeptidase
MGNSVVKPIFDEWLKPFHEVGAKTTTLLWRGSTDHVSFDNVGLPGFGFIQDPLNYDLDFGPRSHHTNLDNYDRIIPDDMKQAATIMAAFVYQAAMLDEKLPRKPATTPVPASIAELYNMKAAEKLIGATHSCNIDLYGGPVVNRWFGPVMREHLNGVGH